jgi:hypothetical protein
MSANSTAHFESVQPTQHFTVYAAFTSALVATVRCANYAAFITAISYALDAADCPTHDTANKSTIFLALIAAVSFSNKAANLSTFHAAFDQSVDAAICPTHTAAQR